MQFDDFNPTIRCIHLSDLHMTSKGVDRFNISTLLPELISDIAEFDPHFIIISGDISYSGQSDEYSAVNELFLDPLIKQCRKLKKENILIAPGNHDVDWNVLKKVPEKIFSEINNQNDITNVFQDTSIFNLLCSASLSFRLFASKYGDNASELKLPVCNINNLTIKNKKISVSLLSSAWFTMPSDGGTVGNEKDFGQLAVGEYQLHQAYSSAQIFKPHISIAVTHHPTNYLKFWDKKITDNYLHKFYDFHLCGHLHYPNFSCTINTLGDLTTIQSGALFSDYHDDSIYNRITWFLNSNRINIVGRKFNRKQFKWTNWEESFDVFSDRKKESIEKISFNIRDYQIQKSNDFEDCLRECNIDFDSILELIDRCFKGHINYFRREFEDLPIPLENKYYVLVSKRSKIIELQKLKPINSISHKKILDWNKIIFDYRKCTYFAYREPDSTNKILPKEYRVAHKTHNTVISSILNFFRDHEHIELEDDESFSFEIAKTINFHLLSSKQELQEADFYFSNRRNISFESANSQAILHL